MSTSTPRPADRSDAAGRPMRGKLSSATRRDFIRGVAAAGASTVGAVALESSGVDLFSEQAFARHRGNDFSDFRAIAPSSADTLEVANGFRADVLISWGDIFRGKDRRALRYGFNNDFLAYFPLRGSREGLLFVNHEYPDPFFLHGYKPNGSAKNAAQVQEEQDSVGNSILHVKRRDNGRWKVVSPSKYNRRIYGDRPDLVFTGPLRGAPGIGNSAHGSLGNCSGGITPWGTALSCEENFDGYGTAPAPNVEFSYGWPQFGGQPEDAEYEFVTFKKYGWVCEHDPYDPELRRPQAHGARPLPAREHGLPPRARQEVRALHGRRQGQRGRLQVRLGPQPALVEAPRRQPADPRGGHALHRALGAGGAAALRGGRRARTRSRTTEGTGELGGGPGGRARRHRHEAAGRASADASSTCTSPPTGRRTWRWPRTAACSSR